MKCLVELMIGSCWGCSILVNSHKVVNLEPANWTFLQVLATSNASCIVFARHVNTVFVILVTNDACVWMCSLAHECCLYCANISLAWTNLENCLICNLEQQTHLSLVRKSSPCSVCCTHVLNVKLVSNRSDCCMNIWQVLVFGEIQQVGLLSANCDFFVVWNFDAVTQGRSFDNLQSQSIIFKPSLELIASHFDDHVLS